MKIYCHFYFRGMALNLELGYFFLDRGSLNLRYRFNRDVKSTPKILKGSKEKHMQRCNRLIDECPRSPRCYAVTLLNLFVLR